MSDEHRRDAMGCAGHPLVQTPHLDALAAAGTRFSRAYTASPMCVPTRAALACGTYVHQNRYWDSATAYDASQPSWMHMLRDAGYETTSIGKLHFKSGRHDNGFSEEILPMHIVGEKGWVVGLLREDPPPYDSAAELAAEIGEGDTSYSEYDRAITDAAVDWLHAPERKQKPFAGFISLVSPHYPLKAPEAFFNLYDPATLPLPADSIPDHEEIMAMADFFDYQRYFDEEKMRLAIAAYYGLVSFMDDCIGRILAALDAAGLTEDTLIIYTSDHGELLGDHGMWTKQVMYEASAGIPLIMRGKGIPTGKVTANGAHLLDLASTALTLAGVDQPSDWPGQNLAAIANAAPDRSRTVFQNIMMAGQPQGRSWWSGMNGNWSGIQAASHSCSILISIRANMKTAPMIPMRPQHWQRAKTGCSISVILRRSQRWPLPISAPISKPLAALRPASTHLSSMQRQHLQNRRACQKKASYKSTGKF